MSEKLSPAQLAAQALRTRKRPHKVVRFPAPPGERTFDVALVVLTHQEIQDAQIEAVRYLTEEKKLDAVKLALLSTNALVEIETHVHHLAVACRSVDDPTMPLWSVEDVRSLTYDEREFLLGEYNAFARERSPISRAQSPEEVSAMIAELKRDGALSAWVTCCERATLESTLLALAALPARPTSESS